jgi:hypothetical protein
MGNHSTSTRPDNPNASLGKRLECPPTNSGATAKHQKIRIVTQWHHQHQRHENSNDFLFWKNHKHFRVVLHIYTGVRVLCLHVRYISLLLRVLPPHPFPFYSTFPPRSSCVLVGVYFDFYFGIGGAPRRRRAPTRAGESYAPLEHKKKKKKKNLCASIHSKTDDFDASIHLICNIQQTS